MRYIRTKEGIYTLISKDEPIYELNGKKYYCVEEQISSFSEDEVINQADTIKELCDGFVCIVDGVIEPLVYRHLDTVVKNILKRDFVYGHIWVFDKDGVPTFKPVAKMNEKGDLVRI